MGWRENKNAYVKSYVKGAYHRFTITFRKDDKKYTIKISEEDNAIHFDGKWYRNFSELCEKAVIDGEKLTSLYYDLYDFKEEKP